MSVINRAVTGSIPAASHAPPPSLEVEFEGHRLTQAARQPTLAVKDQLKHVSNGAQAAMCPRLDSLIDHVMNGLADVSLPR